jgi:hypothetical protein
MPAVRQRQLPPVCFLHVSLRFFSSLETAGISTAALAAYETGIGDRSI